MADFKYSAGIDVNLNVKGASNQLKDLQKQLQQISNMKVDIGTGNLTADIEKASEAAMKLSAHLATATNPQTGNLDFTKFYTSIQKSGASLEDYGKALQNMGPAGQKAFVSLADSISKAEIPLKRTSKLVDGMWDNLKKTIGWQMSSSMVHGFIGSMQQAMGYAKDLNKSLTDIRIVTGASSDQMAQFAKEANKAAKSLSTTTTDYTKASLIYYQQGLSDQEVKARTETTIKMANATGTSAQKVSDQMTAIWNNFDNGTKSLTHYADVMTALGAATASSTDEIAEGLQKFASISDTVGLSYEYAASALATITSTSRESADVVGNSLKTLFSRIQGLQLGETLDDGTTLNKYSTAMAKVGISIKDSSGELKDMDTILDEMGTKWQTLANDEKMALAQTVAGVRQYTQLMTLMENWDQFKSNLNVANTSSGTLDMQAAIYAESWEAASNRVRASWEGLWDNLIDSDSAVAVLDTMSSFVDILNTITTGLGGAGGALSHFSAIFLKLFTPKIGENINNIGYGIKMMFGGRDRMKSAREEWLENAKGSLSGDSGIFDIGASEGKAYQDVLQQRINTSLAYSQHWDSMSAEERIYAQAAQKRYEDFGANYIEAGKNYDAYKNALGESYWDLYSLEDNKAVNPLDKREKSLLPSEQEQLKSHQEALRKIQGKETESFKKQRVEHEAIIKELTDKQGLTYGERLKKQASAMLDFENTISSFGDNSVENMKAFENSWKQLDEVLSTVDEDKIPRGAKLFKENMQALIESGDIEGAKAYAAGSTKGLNDIVARTFADNLGLDRDALLSYMNNATGTEISKRNFEAYQNYQKQLEQQELQGRKKDPRNWGEGLTSAAEGAMATMSLVQQIKALTEGGMNAGEVISSLVTGVGSAGMAISGFASALQAVGVASGAAAGWIGLIVTALGVLGSFAVDYISDIYNADKIAAQQASESATAQASVVQEAKNYSNSLKNQITTYKEAQEAINQSGYTDIEREQAIYESNKLARLLISQENLSEQDGDYTSSNGRIKISETTLNDIEERAEEKILEADIASQISSLAAKDVMNQSTKTDLERDLLSQGGAGIGAKVLTGLEWGLGAFLTAAGIATGWTGAGIAVAGAGLAGMAHATSQMQNMNNYEKDINQGLNIIEKDSSLLDKDKDQFLQALIDQGISSQAAEILYQNKTQLLNYTQALEEQNISQKLANESLTRNIVAQNENISNLDQNEKILNGATEKYSQAIEQEKKSLETFADKSYDEKMRLADEVVGALGLENLKDFQWTGDNTGDKELTYTYTDETGATVDGQVSYDRIINAQVSQAGIDAVNEYSDDMASIYSKLQQNYGKDTANGLLSMLAGDNFENATTNEMNKAKEQASQFANDIASILKDLESKGEKTGTDADIAGYIQSQFGMDVTSFKTLFEIDPSTNLIDWFRQFQNITTSAQKLIQGEPLLSQWVGDNKSISDNLTQNTLTSLYDSFKKASLLGGEQAGKDFLTGITDILSNSGLDQDEYDQAMQGLLAIDWSNTLTSAGAAAAVIENLGGTLDTTTAAWQAFAAAMAAAAGAMPDFSGLISQLTQLAGSLQGLSKGGTVGADIRDQLVAMNPEFADLFSKHYSGDYTFIGDDNQVLSDAIWNKMNETKADASAIQQKYDDYMAGKGKGQEDNDNITADDFGRTWDGAEYVVSQNHASQLAQIAGYNLSTQTDILNNYDKAKGRLDAWDSDLGVITDSGSLARRTADGGFETYNKESGEWEAAEGSDLYDFAQEYEADTAKYGAAKGARDTMLDAIHGLDEVSGEWKPEEIEQAISSASLLSDVLGRVREGQAGLIEENGNLSESTIKGIEAWTAQNEVSERTQAAIDSLIAAEEYLQEVRENGGDVKSAEDIRDEALAYAELQATIDEVAAARGLDADAIAGHVSRFQSEIDKLTDSNGKVIESTNDYYKRLTALAVEYEENSEGLADLQSAYKDYNSAVKSGNQQAQTKAWENMRKAIAKITKLPLNKVTDEFMKQAKNAKILEKALKGDVKAIAELEDLGRMEALTDATSDVGKALQTALTGLDFGEGIEGAKNFVSELNSVLAQTDMGQMISEANAGTAQALGALFDSLVTQFGGGTEGLMKAAQAMNGLGIGVMPTSAAESDVSVDYSGSVTELEPDGYGGLKPKAEHEVEQDVDGEGAATGLKFYDLGGGGGSSGGGGGGGGGGPKEPKKVANKRKSQTVKRYKRNDAKRKSAERSKKSVENQKDYLYGETKIAQMEKINKLAEKESKITKDRIQESQKYLIEDRENLIKYMQKYGIEAEFDSEGFLKNYEQAWSKIYEEIAVLYEDNLLTEDEEKIEEDLNVKLEELEGVLEDYENSLEELADDIEKYEESLYEQYDNKIDAIQHKVEFKIELNEDDIEYIDFLLEVLGDTASYSVNRIELINQKMDALFNSISTIKEGIAEIYDISNDELQVFATGGLDIEGLLTEAQVEKLRELRDQLMEEMQSLIEEYQKAMEEPLTVFDSWTEKIDHSIATVEHYSSILSQLRNVIDITGRDMYGFTDTFMRNLETITISQSLDTIAVNREYYESLIAQQAEAEAGLMQAREQGDEATIAKWEEIVRTTTEAAQSAREALVSGLENTLTLISDQFTAALEDAVKNFNDALYASGGLEGLSNDYSLMREHADLMAADYDKIYNLSKLTRNINKSLDDTKIIAGKQKLNSLLEEINALQATGVELSKYDLEYLEAKYNLYLAQIELENARNAKDTVTLSRDSEGNWAYVYTSNEEKIAEAEQKYEDALYEMQNKNHEYMEEMSSNMIAMTQQMQEEMAELNPADFANPEEYRQALQEIQDKYDKLLKAQNDELNKAIENNASLYETDWKNYSRYTGYKISDDEKWIDSFKETTLGHLIGSDSMDSDFQNTVYKLTTELSKGLSEAAVNYFKGIDEALKTYGTSIDEFGSNIINTTTSIRMESIEVGESIEDMASKMQTAFKDAADALKAFQETRLPEITTQLGEISTIISQINKDIRDSANIINDKDTSLIGDSKAVDLLNESGLFGTWTYNKRGDMDIVDENGNKTEGTNFQAYNAKLIEELDKARSDYQEGKITKEDLDEMYERYWMFKDIINRIYNSDNLVDPPAAFDTGGYTGEWGNAGKLAMLHQKELILNPDDTENFLEAIKLTKDMMSVLDFQIQYAKLGMGVLEAYDLQHQPSETVIEQQVTIQAEFPNVSDHNEVEEAIYNLINTASQYANRQ